MAYKLKLRESLEGGVRRILAEQCQRAATGLTETADAVTAVHDARKCIKRSRALLRLVRPAIGDAVWKDHDAALRDVGRGLSEMRDRDVLRQTVEKLKSNAPATLKNALGAIGKQLADGETGDAVPAPAEARRRLVETAALLDAVSARLRKLHVPGSFETAVEPGVEKGHAKARRLLDEVRQAPAPETLHELRKAIQVHWRHMVVLSAAWPEVTKGRAAEARTVSNLLGEDRDLILLEAYVTANAGGLTKSAVMAIRRAIASRRRAIAAEAFPRAERLLVGKSARFARDFTRLWSIATGLSEKPRARQSAEAMDV
jgi:CHAD domain-containing protein